MKIRTTKSAVKKSFVIPRGEDESVERIRRGREEKERIANILKNGFLDRKRMKKEMKKHKEIKKSNSITTKDKVIEKTNHELLRTIDFFKYLVKALKRESNVVLCKNAKEKLNKVVVEHKREARDGRNQKKPMATIELNVGNGKKESVMVYEGDNSSSIVNNISKKYST